MGLLLKTNRTPVTLELYLDVKTMPHVCYCYPHLRQLHKELYLDSRRQVLVIKCNAFLCFQSYIVRDISLTEIYRWLVAEILIRHFKRCYY